MKNKLIKQEAQEKIDDFFSTKDELSPKYVKKIKRLAMRYNIKLGKYRRRFCKKCYSDLKYNVRKIRITKTHKIVECRKCGYINKWKTKSRSA